MKGSSGASEGIDDIFVGLFSISSLIDFQYFDVVSSHKWQDLVAL